MTATCPKCGAEIKSATVRGPSEAILEPCGHTVPASAVPSGDEE